MSVEPGLVAHLLADPSIAALVGDRVYPAGRIPEAAPLPAVTYQRVSTVAQHTLQGLGGLTQVRMQVTAWAEGDSGYAAAKAIASAVIASLVGFRGTWAGGVGISGVNFDSMQDIDPDPDSELVGVDMDFLIWHRGAVP